MGCPVWKFFQKLRSTPARLFRTREYIVYDTGRNDAQEVIY